MKPTGKEVLIAASLLVIATTTHEALGHAKGAGTSVCQTMIPGHGQDPQPSGSNPWQLSTDKAILEPAGGKEYVTLVLKKKAWIREEQKFQGFMIQARDIDTGELVGEFFGFG